jgi:hypothetical protein
MECGDGGNPFACTEYDQECKCDATKFDCQAGTCRSRCTMDSDCTNRGGHCSGGQCVACTDDSMCMSMPGTTCVNGACIPPCVSDSDCPLFDRCSSGKCIDSGCQTNRECVAATRNVEATCGTNGKCIIPCATDLECGSPTSYKFFSCINRQCIFVGCMTDKDCELLFGLDGGTGLNKDHPVCRDKATTSPTTP